MALQHAVVVGRHDEVLGRGQAAGIGVLLPPGVVALVGDVALAAPRLEPAQVQPRLVVLQWGEGGVSGDYPGCFAVMPGASSLRLCVMHPVMRHVVGSNPERNV